MVLDDILASINDDVDAKQLAETLHDDMQVILNYYSSRALGPASEEIESYAKSLENATGSSLVGMSKTLLAQTMKLAWNCCGQTLATDYYLSWKG